MLLTLTSAWPRDPGVVALGLGLGLGLGALSLLAICLGELWLRWLQGRLTGSREALGFGGELLVATSGLAAWRALQPATHRLVSSPRRAPRLLAWSLSLRWPLLVLAALLLPASPLVVAALALLVLAWGALLPSWLGPAPVSAGAVFLPCKPRRGGPGPWSAAWARVRARWGSMLACGVVAGLLLAGGLHGEPSLEPAASRPLISLVVTALGVVLAASLPLPVLFLLPLLLVLAWLGLPPGPLLAVAFTSALTERRALAVVAGLLTPPAARRFRQAVWALLPVLVFLAVLLPVVLP